jgi:hypothetical protein
MTVGRQKLEVCLTPAQALRMERMGEALWQTEKLSAAEVTRRLALRQLLWAESERGDGGGGANARLSAARGWYAAN